MSGGAREMFVVRAPNAVLAQRQNELLAVVREFENLIHFVVHDPHMLFRIIGADPHLVRPASACKQMVPLRPVLDQRAVRIDNQNAVLQPRLALGRRNAERAVSSRVSFGRLLRDRQLASLKQDDAIGILREDAALRSPGPSRIAQRFWPARHDFVGAGFILAAFFLRPCGGLQHGHGHPQCTECYACTYPHFHFILH